jgi:hypothetical protein
MSLSSSSMELNGSLKDLRVLWEETKAVWNDAVRQDFERTFWEPLETRVLTAIRAMERLAPILEKAHQECD